MHHLRQITSLFMLLFCAATYLFAGNELVQFKADAKRTGQTHAAFPVHNVSELWKVKIADPGDERHDQTLGSSQVLIANGNAFIRWIDQVYAFNLQTGNQLWNAPYENSALAGGDLGMAFANGLLILPGGSGKVIAIKASDKSQAWTFTGPTGGKVWSPIVAGDEIFVVAGKSLVCLNAANGNEKWTYSNGQTGELAHVAKSGNTLVYTTASSTGGKSPSASTLVAVNASNGQEIWQKSGLDIRQTIALTDDYVITGGAEQTNAYSLTTGDLAWTNFGAEEIERNQGGGGIVVDEDAEIYVSMSDGVKEEKGGAYRFGADQEIWFATFGRDFMPKYGNRSDPWACAPVIAKVGTRSIVGGIDKYGTLLFNDLQSGSSVFEYRFYRGDQEGISRYGYTNFCSPAIVDGKIVIALGDGYVYCLSGQPYQAPAGNPTWSHQFTPDGIETIFDVSFTDAQNGVATSKGRILHTTNGGTNWSEIQTSGMKDWIYGVTYRTFQNATAVGQFATYLNTNNGGASWVSQSKNAKKHAGRAVFFLNEQLGWFCGHNGHIFKTTDGGQSWSKQQGTDNDEDPIYGIDYQDIAFMTENIGLAVGSRGVISKTENGGQSWTAIHENWAITHSNDDFFAIEHLTGSTFIAVGATGLIRKTTDAGDTWTDIAAPVDFTLYDVDFVDQNTGYACGTFGTVLFTNNGGASWSMQNSGTPHALFRMDFSDAGHGWAVGTEGAHGVIVQTSQPGQVSAVAEHGISGTVPESMQLSAAYPNPFKADGPQTQLMLTLDQPEHLSITIYDIRGRNIREASPKSYRSGRYPIQWDARDSYGRAVVPGIYFVQVRSSHAMVTQRILVLR